MKACLCAELRIHQMQCWLPPKCTFLPYCELLTVIRLIQSESSFFSCLKIHYEPHLITKQSQRSAPVFSIYLIDLSKMLSRSLKKVGISDFVCLFVFVFPKCSSYRKIYWIVNWYSLLSQPHLMDGETEAQKVTYSRPDNWHVHRNSS